MLVKNRKSCNTLQPERSSKNLHSFVSDLKHLNTGFPLHLGYSPNTVNIEDKPFHVSVPATSSLLLWQCWIFLNSHLVDLCLEYTFYAFSSAGPTQPWLACSCVHILLSYLGRQPIHCVLQFAFHNHFGWLLLV
jgi:hypothetical protein